MNYTDGIITQYKTRVAEGETVALRFLLGRSFLGKVSMLICPI